MFSKQRLTQHMINQMKLRALQNPTDPKLVEEVRRSRFSIPTNRPPPSSSHFALLCASAIAANIFDAIILSASGSESGSLSGCTTRTRRRYAFFTPLRIFFSSPVVWCGVVWG